MLKDDCFYLGKIVKKHGFKGDVKLRLDVDYPEEYSELESVLVDTGGALVPFFFEVYDLEDKGFVRAHLEGVDDESGAERIVGCDLFLPLTLLPELSGNEFYYHEIIGWEVLDHEHGSIGFIEEVREGNAHDLIVVRNDKTDILIPVADEFIKKVDRENEQLSIEAPEGLIDLYMSL